MIEYRVGINFFKYIYILFIYFRNSKKEITMKKIMLKRLLPIFMTVVMLLSVASAVFPASAASVSAPNEEDPYYQIVFEDGVLTLRLDPDKVYEILRDGDLTKEELKLFIPEDVLATLTDGSAVTAEDILELASNYVTVDDLIELKNMIPEEVFLEHINIDAFTDIITIDEILSVIPVDEMLKNATDEELLAFIDDETLDLLLNEKAKEEVLTDEFYESILNNKDNEDKINEIIEQKHDQLMELVTNEVVNKLFEDESYAVEVDALVALIEHNDTLDRILADDEAVTKLKDFLMSHDLTKLEQDEEAIERLEKSEKIKEFIEKNVVVADIIEDFDIDLTNLASDFGITAGKLADASTEIGLTVSNVKPYVNADAKTLFNDGIINTANITAVYPQITFESLKENAGLLGITSDELQNASTADELITCIDYLGNLSNIYGIDFDSLIDNADELGITVEKLLKYVNINILVKELSENQTIDVNKLANKFNIYVNDLIDKNYITNAQVATIISNNWEKALDAGLAKEIVKCIGIHSLFEDFGRDELVNAIGGYKGIMEKNYVSETDVLDAIGGYRTIIDLFASYFPEKLDSLVDIVGFENWKQFIDITDIIDRAGGYKALFGWYTEQEIIDIINHIGIRTLIDFVRDVGARDSVDFEQVAKDIIDLIRSKDGATRALAKEVFNIFTRILTNEVVDIYLNDDPATPEKENTIYHNGVFDFQEIVTTAIQALPDIDDFLNMKSGDRFTQLIFTTEIRGKEIQLGFAIEFIGDLTRLQKLAESRREYFEFNVSEDMDIEVSMVLPTVVSELYGRALNSSRISDEMKARLLKAPTMTVNEMSVFLSEFTDEELEAYAEEILADLDGIKARVYAKLEAAIGSDSALLERAKAKVDDILEKCTDGEKLAALRDKGVNALDKVYNSIGDKTIADLYDGNGHFSFDKTSFSVDLKTWISKIVTIPESILTVFGNDLTVSGSVKADLTVKGLYSLTVVDFDGTKNTFFLPEGAPLTLLNNENIDVDYVFTDEVMPAEDTTITDLYTIRFLYENGKTYKEIFYKKGTTEIDVPTVPEKTGYTGEWASYVLGSDKNIDVRPIYTGIPHEEILVNGVLVKIEGEYELSADSKEIPEKYLPEPNKPGYSRDRWFYDHNGNGKFDEDEDFFVDYDEKTGNYIIPEGKSLPGINVDGGERYNFSSTYNLIYYKAGYSINGKAFTLDVTVETRSVSIEKLSKVGHTFVGWFVDINHNGIKDGDDFMLEEELVEEESPSVRRLRSSSITDDEITIGEATTYNVPEDKQFPPDDVTVSPLFSTNTYTITFMAEGKLVKEVIYVYGGSIIEPNVPEKTGHTGYWKYYELGAYDLTVNAAYTANIYTVTFKADGKEVDKVEYTYGDEALSEVPDVPAKKGYTGVWGEVTLGASDSTVEAVYTAIPHNGFYVNGTWVETDGEYKLNADSKEIPKEYLPEPNKPGYNRDKWFYDHNGNGKFDEEEDFFVEYDEESGNYKISEGKKLPGIDTDAGEKYNFSSTYTPIVYEIEYTVNGETHKIELTVETQSVILPETSKTGYTFKGWFVDVNGNGELDEEDFMLVEGEGTYNVPEGKTFPTNGFIFSPFFEPNKYTITFMADGELVKEVIYVFDQGITEPEVPGKIGHSGAWEKYDLKAENITVNAVYTANKYTVHFTDGKEIIASIEYTYGDDTLTGTIPNPPVKAGYTAEWIYDLAIGDDQTATVKYTLITYKITFVDENGNVIKEVTFDAENPIKAENVPAVPSKVGYTGAWEKYDGILENRTVKPVYTVITYTVTFKADGKVVGTVNFTVNDKTVKEPAVPSKKGFTGAWEKYQLKAEDITVNAVYTPNPTIVDDEKKDNNLLWWILLAIVIILLIIWIISKKKTDKDKEPEPEKTEPAAEVVTPTPEPVVVVEAKPEPPVIEKVEAVDVATADELMTDAVAEAVIEAVPGGCFTGLKAIINISDINAAFSDGDVVDLKALKAKKLIPAASTRLKVLANGKLEKSITVYSEQFSVQAVKMITLTGGKAIQLKK